MTKRFYFDLENDHETIHDEEGVEAASLEEAIDEARSVIYDMSDELNIGVSAKTWTLVVRDKSGALVGRLPIEK